MTEFEGVHPALGQALTKRGYTVLTPVQQAVLAPELANADALVSAQTGSGKTVAFGMALAPTLLDGEERFGRAEVPLALAVAPTRELALQVKRELEWLFELTGASVTSCVGGMDMRAERRALDRGAHIVVGTPGRLRDHIERGSFDTSGLRAVVLDEADEMLDLGFREDLEYILQSAPKDRRTLMFSATVPRSIGTLAKRYQRDAVRISTQSDKKQHVDIDYQALPVAPNDRENAIINLLRYHNPKNALVFCATRATVNHMTARFTNRGFSVVALSGELSQDQRTHALQAMRDGRAQVCIATDVAARGIDLPNLELVIHADIPKTSETLLHRSGRTGRAGRKGTCALIVPYNWRKRVERLLSSANVKATWGKPPSADDIMKRDRERIIDDPAFSEEITEFEQTFAQELLDRHGPDKIAAALVRLHLSKQTAPEELLDAAPDKFEKRDKRKQRDDFKDGVWFALSVGRDHQAEARWLLPMLCRVGNLVKGDIGAIKIHQNETHVELAPGCVDKFLEAVGPSRKVEKTITVDRLKGVPDGPTQRKPRETLRAKPRKPAPRPDSAKNPYSEATPDPEKPHTSRSDAPKSGPSKPDGKSGAKRPFAKKPFKASEGDEKSRDDKPNAAKPWDKNSGKPRGKKPQKSKFAPRSAAGKDKAGPKNRGSAPLKRKRS